MSHETIEVLLMVGFGAVNIILVPIVIGLIKAIFKNRTDLEAHKLYVANNFTKTHDLQKMFNEVKSTLSDIWKELKDLNKTIGGR